MTEAVTYGTKADVGCRVDEVQFIWISSVFLHPVFFFPCEGVLNVARTGATGKNAWRNEQHSQVGSNAQPHASCRLMAAKMVTPSTVCIRSAPAAVYARNSKTKH
ncbi:hypothetical protein Cob_v003862 [Colletotrichum orbiculare MAFF 240422]|uniref:Uncharacterized protein n=1 Tax=Colletotrichum orbiculare (strain 104-T / ATCC 96160 / CBS 514.97 / LARS 414 / MAFF 240422) TaxID=1213857 RepID=A0A484FZ46_COLOR|nr:hypothetical protein Cob_v003862 [Colletotrichum orbiculare MAFF 240422]